MQTEPLFRPEAVAHHHRSRLHGSVIVILPPAIWMVATLLSAIVLALAAFLVWGEYARKETVTGRLSPGPGVVKVYSPQIGLVAEVAVEESRYVTKGEALLTVEAKRYGDGAGDDTEQGMLAALARQRGEIDLQIGQQKSLLEAQAPYYLDAVVLLRQETSALEGQLAEQRELIRLAEADMAASRELLSKGHVSPVGHRKVEEQRAVQQQKLRALEERLASQRNLLLRTEFESRQTPLTIAGRISELETKRSDVVRNLLDLSSRRSTVIKAPVSGYVSFLQVSEGKAISPDFPLLSIVPSKAALVAELYVPSKAIGFVETGQEVRLLFDAFPYERFGSYKGRITQVANTVLTPDEIPVPVDSEESVYKVVVELSEQWVMAYGNRVPLQPDMALKADLIFDRRALYEWMLEPFYAVRGRLL